MSTDDFLASMSSAIASLQKSPGRLLQSLSQSSLEVWTNSNSGVGANAKTVSYYVKGNVVSFLLDAHIRRVTNGRKSMDDAMRVAYERYGGERGFTADELRAVVEAIAGRGVKAWWTKRSTRRTSSITARCSGGTACALPAAQARAGRSKCAHAPPGHSRSTSRRC